MPARADLGFLVVAAAVSAVICMYVRRRWRMSVERAAEVRRLTWMAVEEAARAELESEALVYGAPVVITSSSSLSEDDGGANGVSMMGSQCAVCSRRTSTRCSRCKAVRYCSGKCQIMHWRQGHKDSCHPPKIDHGNKHGESFSSSKVLPTSNYVPSEYAVQIKSRAQSKHQVVTSSTYSSHKSNSSSTVSDKDRYSTQPVVDEDGTESSLHLPDDSSSPMSSTSSSSSSVFSKHLLTQDDASSCDESHVPDNEENVPPCIENLGGEPTVNSHEYLPYTSNIKHKIHNSKTNNSKISFGGTNNSLLKEKSTRPQSSLFCVNHESSNDILSKKDNVRGLIMKSAVNADSVTKGIGDLKTSVKRAVQQLKSSHISKHSSGIIPAVSIKHQMLFPHELFVRLYNCGKVDMRPCGLTNCGNSCYANVVLQCLAFTPPLTSYLLQGYHAKSCSKRGWCFTCEFASLLAKAKQGQSPLSPIGILSQMHNIGSNLEQGRQEDAHEFLRYAIEAMQLVCLKEAGVNAAGKFATMTTTFIQMIFGGYLRSKIKCMRCRRTSECNELIMDLTVEIHGDIETLEEALARFTATEILDGDNRYECSSCKSYERAKKKLTILEAPNVLTIALKRFQSQSGKFGKLNKAVQFPETLDLGPYTSCTNDRSNVYSLYAVVVHQGIMNAASSGHYICYVKSINKWYKTDDSKVKPVDIGKVLANSAYMLFYARCSPKPLCAIESMSSPNHQKHKPSKLHAHQPITLQPTNNKLIQKLPYSRTDSSSDISSIFSLSDEGSYSTDSTRDSTSTEELSEYIFGRCSSSVLSEDSDFGPIYSPFVGLERRDSPQILYSDSRKLTEDNYYRASRETDMMFRRSNATRERRDQEWHSVELWQSLYLVSSFSYHLSV